MTLKDSVQTAFLVVGFFTILVFGASYYFTSLDTQPTDQPLKDSLAITASFFGGFATLTAAHIGSKLFNDWRDQHRAAYITSIGDSIGNAISGIFQKLSELDIIILKSENIRGSFHMSFIESKKRERIFENIPHIDSLCSEILFEVVNLEKEITQLQVATKYSCDNIEQQYVDFKKQVELMVGDVLKDPDTNMRYQKISKGRRFISLIEPQYKDFLRKIYTEIDNLNTPK